MLLGFNLNDDAVTVAIYFITLAFVVGSFFGLRWLLALRFGKLLRASRDGSNRMRLLGYDPAPYKVVAFTIAAVMTGVSRSEEHTSELQSLMRISYAVFCVTKKNKSRH